MLLAVRCAIANMLYSSQLADLFFWVKSNWFQCTTVIVLTLAILAEEGFSAVQV